MKHQALKSGIFDNLHNDEATEMKDAYYNVACNVEPLIQSLELALLNERNNANPLQANIHAIETELRIYRQIMFLKDNSNLGAIL